MSLKLYKDVADVATENLADDASVSTIPENGSFKSPGSSFLSKKNPFAYSTNRLILANGAAFDLYDGLKWRQIVNRGDMEIDPASLLDTGSGFAVGVDYYVYLALNSTGDPVLVVSGNATYPDGFSAENSRKIGGFHYGHIRKVSDRWVPVDSLSVEFGANDTIWQNNVTVGIIPNSVWDLKNRPSCAPEGMAKVGRLWFDIYQSSAAEAITWEAGISGQFIKTGALQSKYGALPVTGTEGCSWYAFTQLAARAGKRLPTYAEWITGAYGNPGGQEDADDYGWTKTSNGARTRTGCRVVAADGSYGASSGIKPYAVSAYNLVDCVGNVWEWLDSLFARDTSSGSFAWQDSLNNASSENKGQVYAKQSAEPGAALAGGYWHNGVHAGSRTVHLSYYAWYVGTYIGCRLACDNL